MPIERKPEFPKYYADTSIPLPPPDERAEALWDYACQYVDWQRRQQQWSRFWRYWFGLFWIWPP